MSQSATWLRSRWRRETFRDRAELDRAQEWDPRTDATPLLHLHPGSRALPSRLSLLQRSRPSTAGSASDARSLAVVRHRDAREKRSSEQRVNSQAQPRWIEHHTLDHCYEVSFARGAGTCGSRRRLVRTTRLAAVAQPQLQARVRRAACDVESASRAGVHRRRAAGNLSVACYKHT